MKADPKKPRKKKKSNSRAARFERAIEALQAVLTEAENMLPDQERLEELTDEDTGELTGEGVKILGDINTKFTMAFDVSEIESLKDEIENWKNNIEEKFSETQKYQDLCDCVDALQEGIDNLQGVEGGNDFDEAKDAIEELNSVLDDLESNVTFPTMFG